MPLLVWQAGLEYFWHTVGGLTQWEHPHVSLLSGVCRRLIKERADEMKRALGEPTDDEVAEKRQAEATKAGEERQAAGKEMMERAEAATRLQANARGQQVRSAVAAGDMTGGVRME